VTSKYGEVEDPAAIGPDRTRTLRAGIVAVVVLVLLAVVALASRSGYGRHAGVARPTPGYVSWAMSVFLILFVLMIPFAAYSYFAQQRHKERSQQSFQARVLRSLGILFAVLVLGAAVSWAARTGHFPTLSRFGLGGAGAGSRHLHGGTTTQYTPTFKWPVLWATLAVLAVLGAAGWWTWRRRADLAPTDEQETPAAAEALAVSIDDALDDLEAEPDARRAVVAAYARMEAALARNGLERSPSETPVEYLRRILLGFTSRGDAVARLTSLFERAKFSSHEIDTPMKREAITALCEIRDDLQAAPA
jgi:hypothetical protein